MAEGIFTQEALRVYFIADGVSIPFSIYAYKYLCRYRYAQYCLSDRRILHYEFGNIEIYNMIPIGSRIFTFLIGRFCEKIPYFMKNSYKQLANV